MSGFYLPDQIFEQMFRNTKKAGRKRLLNEKEVLKFVKLSLRRKIPPTVREVSRYFRISVGTAYAYLQTLRRQGLLQVRRVDGKSRSVARGIKV